MALVGANQQVCVPQQGPTMCPRRIKEGASSEEVCKQPAISLLSHMRSGRRD